MIAKIGLKTGRYKIFFVLNCNRRARVKSDLLFDTFG